MSARRRSRARASSGAHERAAHARAAEGASARQRRRAPARARRARHRPGLASADLHRPPQRAAHALPEAGRHSGLRAVRRGRRGDRWQGHPAGTGARRLRAPRPRVRVLPARSGRAARAPGARRSGEVVVGAGRDEISATRRAVLHRPGRPGRAGASGRLRRAGAARGTGRAHRRPGPVRRDPAGERSGRGGRDHAVDRAPDRQPRVDEDRARGGQRARRRDEEGAPRRAACRTSMIRTLDARGDAALCEQTARLDGWNPARPEDLALAPRDFENGARAVAADVRAALEYAAERIERYHAAAMPKSWRMTDEHGSVLGQEVRALDRVGVYVPGGRAAYPSTVLMTAVPARVAGVREIVLVTPAGAGGRIDPVVLAAARIAGVTEGYRIGGAQAVAALAYGTSLIRRVDKIVGPGNIYVALAKARVFGEVGIDMVAGPSEVVVIADAGADAEWIAGDLLAQAEHDPMARALLITDASELIPRVEAALERQLEALPRRAIAEQALRANGALIRVATLDDAVTLANLLAPEHLELLVTAPTALLPRVKHAGAVFLGAHSPEVVGDYVAGPNHVLPTAGTARFASPLSTEDFVKRSSVIEYSRGGLRPAAPHLKTLSRIEGLDAHGNAAALRLDADGGKTP